jgi:hypothetical protein
MGGTASPGDPVTARGEAQPWPRDRIAKAIRPTARE